MIMSGSFWPIAAAKLDRPSETATSSNASTGPTLLSAIHGARGPYRVGGRPLVVTRRARAYPPAASRSSPNASASRGAGHEALRPLGLGSAHTRVSPMVPSCGPTAAPGRPNATR